MTLLSKMASVPHLKSVNLKMLTCVDGTMKKGTFDYHNTSYMYVCSASTVIKATQTMKINHSTKWEQYIPAFAS